MFILVSFSFVKLPHLGLTYFPKWGFLFIKVMDNKLDDIEILYFAICNQIGLYNSFLEDNKNNLDFTRNLQVDARLFFDRYENYLRMLREFLTSAGRGAGAHQNTCYCGTERL